MASVISVGAPIRQRFRHTKFPRARDEAELGLAFHTCIAHPSPNFLFLCLINAPLTPSPPSSSPPLLNPHILISSPGPISRSAVSPTSPATAIAPQGLFFPNSTEHNIRNLSRQRQTDIPDKTRRQETGERRANYHAAATHTHTRTHRAENQVIRLKRKRRVVDSLAYSQYPLPDSTLSKWGASVAVLSRPLLPRDHKFCPKKLYSDSSSLPPSILHARLSRRSFRYQIIGPFRWCRGPPPPLLPIRVELPPAVRPALHDDLMTKNLFAWKAFSANSELSVTQDRRIKEGKSGQTPGKTWEAGPTGLRNLTKSVRSTYPFGREKILTST